MPNFFTDSKSSILGLSNEVSFVTKYFWNDGENQENIFPYGEGAYIFFHDCIFAAPWLKVLWKLTDAIITEDRWVQLHPFYPLDGASVYSRT